MVIFIIVFFLTILITGFVMIRRTFILTQENLLFANEYRKQFVELANNFYKTYDRFDRKGEIHHEAYVWLTKNANKIQGLLGRTGLMEYIAPFQRYVISNYNIVL